MSEASWTRAGIVALLAAAGLRLVGEFGIVLGRVPTPPLLYLDGALVFVGLVALLLGRREYGPRHRRAVAVAGGLFALSFAAAAFGHIGAEVSFAAGVLVGVVALVALPPRLPRLVLFASLVSLLAPLSPRIPGVSIVGDAIFALGAWMTLRTLPLAGGRRAAKRGLV